MKAARRRRGEKSPRIRVVWILENILCAPLLEDFPGVEHHLSLIHI